MRLALRIGSFVLAIVTAIAVGTDAATSFGLGVTVGAGERAFEWCWGLS